MSKQEYHTALLQAAHISLLLTDTLTENEANLFEAYCDLYEQIVKYECKNQK